MDTLGSRLVHAREARGLSSVELFKRAKLKSPSHLRMIERGERPEPSAKTISALAAVLGVRERWLVLGTGPMDDTSDVDPSELADDALAATEAA
jgi:transcriptional regulator with XRE-family HTH domain